MAARTAAAAVALLLLMTAPAAAKLVVVHTNAAGGSRLVSITPRAGAVHAAPRSNRQSSDPLLWGGGPVMHSNAVYAIFWNPTSNTYNPNDTVFKGLVERWFTDVAHDSGLKANVYSVAQQYFDASGRAAYASAFDAAVTDTQAYPPTASQCVDANAKPGEPCLTDQQIQDEVTRLRGTPGVPTAGNTIYFVFLPQHVHACYTQAPDPLTDCSDSPSGFCGYHSPIGSAGPLYAVIPDDDLTGCNDGLDRPEGFPNDPNVDPVLSTVSHEHLETITDPDLNAWADQTPPPNGPNEIADKCQGLFGAPIGSSGGQAFNQSIDGNPYDVQMEWSNDGSTCLERYDLPPSPSFSAGGATAGQPTSFDGRSSSDPDGAVTGFSWSFGDGSGGSGATPSHVYANPGVYNVTLTVTDDGGRSATTTQQVGVADAPPVAAFSWSPGAHRRVSFNGRGSHARSGSIASYVWNFGDGRTASGARPSHRYAHRGDHTVTLTVIDTAGGSATVTRRVAVDDPPLELSWPRSAKTRHRVGFKVHPGRDPDHDRVVAYRWDFGDGSTASGRSVSHTYPRAGRYTVTLTVVSGDGVSTPIAHSLRVKSTRRHRAPRRIQLQSLAAVLADALR